jgi:hypothetical protein
MSNIEKENRRNDSDSDRNESKNVKEKIDHSSSDSISQEKNNDSSPQSLGSIIKNVHKHVEELSSEYSPNLSCTYKSNKY